MVVPKLKAEVRSEVGGSGLRKLRASGYVPAVLYGNGEKTETIKLETQAFIKLLGKQGSAGTFELELDGNSIPVLVKEVQRHPTKNMVLHADFQRISADKKVRLRIPVVIQNREFAESKTSGVVEQQLMEVELQCLPKYIPQYIAVDASKLEFGDLIKLSDLDIYKDENYEFFTEPDEVIVSLTASNKQAEEEEEKEAPIYESDKSILDV